MSPQSSRKLKTRTDEEYEIDAVAKAFRVVEAMQDATTLAIQTQRIASRTGLPYNFCYRVLKTMKLAGYVAEVEDGWKLTPRLARISGKLAQTVKVNSEQSESYRHPLTESKGLI